MKSTIVPDRDKISTFFLVCFFFVYFAVPKSFTTHVGGDFREFSLHLMPWYIQRYLLVVMCLVYITSMLVKKRVKMSVNGIAFITVSTVFSTIQLIDGEYVVFYATVGSITSYILVCNSSRVHLSNSVRKILVTFLLLYVSQYLFFRVDVRITGSFLDPNISGYYLFLCYCLFRFSRLRVFSLIVAILGFMSWSRNFYLAVFLFEVVNLSIVENFLRKKIKLTSPLVLSFLAMVAVIFTSFFIVSLADYNTTIGSSADRVTNINDGSNYDRAKANTDMLARLAEGEFILFGNGSDVDSETNHRPHNAFLRAIYRYGIVLATLSFFAFFFVCRKLGIYSYPAFIALFSYYCILNDFITGSELVLLTCFYITSFNFREWGHSRLKKRFFNLVLRRV